jgi:hypothetical protein
MRVFSSPWLHVALLSLMIEGCCTRGPCLDTKSTVDKKRIGARKAKLGKVLNDEVSGAKRDRTDWKYIILTKPGKLTVQLHWDNGKANLKLSIFDVMGIKIQEGRVWGLGGKRAVVAVEERGRYYIRVRARTHKDASHYALRLIFKPDQASRPKICHVCVPGDRKCLGSSGFVICETVAPECNAWFKQVTCPAATPCKDGKCGHCEMLCTVGQTKCASKGSYLTCQLGEDGCPTWSDPNPCAKTKRCSKGKCKGRRRTTRGTTRRPPPPKPQPVKKVSRCKIISIYKYRGRMTLHLECGEFAKNIRPGMIGSVLNGNTGGKLPGGEIKVTKVSGHYAIATTTLEKLGKNRWVKIRTK